MQTARSASRTGAVEAASVDFRRRAVRGAEGSWKRRRRRSPEGTVPEERREAARDRAQCGIDVDFRDGHIVVINSRELTCPHCMRLVSLEYARPPVPAEPQLFLLTV